ncbi:lysylphosphatidylglycerol synthase transmembrane domain-containing protein [Haladaptatus pallidirubidus]|uniref:Lysylphosphatidylglycerol synthase transmembrane domain-containing protein n=1 Tax=Haladaptatus pallidirubidus TaxID=1008152 RepID=A0AAV3UEU9_9EURY|nr:lysylphosphatidylglycerol synthase transmembrane domain-containing protein [Haladaptatus pallidirubidus]
MRLDLGDLRTVTVGFVAAVAVLLVVFSIVGIDHVVSALSMADARIVAAVAVVAVLWLFSWAMSLRTVLGILGVHTSPLRAFFLYAGATFANNVTPFGQAGGEPFTALLISRVTDAEYETSLGAIATVDSINFVPSISFALVGIAYYTTVLTLGSTVELVALSIVALALSVPIVVVFAWRRRNRLGSSVAGVVVPAVGLVARVVPPVTPTTKPAVKRRIQGFFGTIERIAGDRRGLLLALFFSAFGWLLSSLSLWLSLYSLGHPVPFAAVLFIVPIGSIAGVAPLPGGLGGVEAALVLLLVPITGVTAATAGAAAVIHRGATYWLPTMLGGVTTAMLEADNANGELPR